MGVETPPFSLQASNYSAEVTRRAIYALLARGGTIGSVVGGLVGAGDMLITAGSGMQVLVAPGEGIIPGSTSATQSGYYGRVSSSTALAIAASDPTNPRVDRVVALVKDAAYTGTENLFTVAVLTGTPTSGATLGNRETHGYPAAPASSLTLGPVLVPAKASSIVSGDIENVAPLLNLGLHFPTASLVGTISTAQLAALAVATAKIAEEAVTDAKVVKGRALIDTGNIYTPEELPSLNEEIEANSTRMVYVSLIFKDNKNLYTTFTVTVGGVIVGEVTTGGAVSKAITFGFLCPPKSKWKATTSAEGELSKTRYMIL